MAVEKGDIRKEDLKDYGFLAYIAERFFRALQYLPPQLLLSNRADVQKTYTTVDNKVKKKMIRRRARKVDLYISSWIAFEVFAAYIIIRIPSISSTFKTIVIILLIMRLIDIIQVNVNLSVFDYLRTKKNDYVASLVRVLVNTMINYFEMIICFGTIYIVNIDKIKNAKRWFDGFYFSVTTQLTIGYGDLSPLGINKLIASIQGLLGVFFSLIIISRFIALLPQVKSIIGDSKQ